MWDASVGLGTGMAMNECWSRRMSLPGRVPAGADAVLGRLPVPVALAGYASQAPMMRAIGRGRRMLCWSAYDRGTTGPAGSRVGLAPRRATPTTGADHRSWATVATAAGADHRSCATVATAARATGELSHH